MATDYYELLNVDRDADQAEIKKAYRKLAMKYHPDRNQGDKDAEEKFKEASEAYSVLGDKEKKQIYDQYGIEGLKGTRSGFGGFGGFSDIFSNSSVFSEFEDILGGFFGFGGNYRSGGANSPRRGEDLVMEVKLTMKESYLGVEKEIEIHKNVQCDECNGTGAREGTKSKTCPQCAGSGTVRRSQGFFSISSTCHVCQGEGVVIEHPCKKCGGSKLIAAIQRKKVSFPAGIDTGNKLRISGSGEDGTNNGRPGDLYLVINVETEEGVSRSGNDLVVEFPISFSQAVLGNMVELETYYGKEKLKIPPRTQSGTIIKIKNKGFKNVSRWGKGDMLIVLQLVTPQKLSKQETKLFEELRELEKANVR
jgi:molecular chaperone DnaJ